MPVPRAACGCSPTGPSGCGTRHRGRSTWATNLGSGLLDVLDALKAADVGERIRSAAETAGHGILAAVTGEDDYYGGDYLPTWT
jgi:hypothetical protein